ncbi:MAG: hypothetical protein ACI9MF_001327, partial [Gammaproteobacteria bacterium]
MAGIQLNNGFIQPGFPSFDSNAAYPCAITP